MSPDRKRIVEGFEEFVDTSVRKRNNELASEASDAVKENRWKDVKDLSDTAMVLSGPETAHGHEIARQLAEWMERNKIEGMSDDEFVEMFGIKAPTMQASSVVEVETGIPAGFLPKVLLAIIKTDEKSRYQHNSLNKIIFSVVGDDEKIQLEKLNGIFSKRKDVFFIRMDKQAEELGLKNLAQIAKYRLNRSNGISANEWEEFYEYILNSSTYSEMTFAEFRKVCSRFGRKREIPIHENVQIRTYPQKGWRAEGLRAITAINPDGSFKYETVFRIAEVLLSEDDKDDPRVRRSVADDISEIKASLARKILTLVKNQGLENMKDVFHSIDVRSAHWKNLYAELAEQYADVTPEDFIKNVLDRFSGSYRKSHEKIKGIEKRVKPSDINPESEYVLCGVLRSKKRVIETDVLEGYSIEEIAEQDGWKGESLTAICDLSREKFASISHKINRDEVDQQLAFINNSVRQLCKDRTGWHQISKDYPAFKILYHLVAALREHPQKQRQLLEIISKRNIIRVNTKTGDVVTRPQDDDISPPTI